MTTYSDQNLVAACSTVGGPASGTNCGNPGLVDTDGNYTIFVAIGVYKTCITSPGSNQVINCYVVATGNGNAGGGGGTAPTTSVSVNPNTLNFGTVQTNPTTPPQLPATITNNGSTSVTVLGVNIPGSDFSAVSSTICNIVLDPGAACVFPIQANPTSATAKVAKATVTTNAPVDPQNPLTIDLSTTGTATATFPVSFAGLGLGSGTVTDGGSLNATFSAGVCSGTCSFSYPTGTVVTLTATANPGSTFNTFGGAGLTTSPAILTVTQSQTITVRFDVTPPTFTLNVACAGQGTGTVTSDTGGISATCTAGVLTGTGSAPFVQGSTPILTETPSGSSTFSVWVVGSGAFTGCTSTTCQPTINMNTTVSASFAAPQSGAPLQLIQKISGGTAGTNKVTGVWNNAQQVGDANIVTVQWNDATTTISSISDTVGNTYTQIPTCSPKAGNGFTTAMYYSANIPAASAGANTVTVNLSASPSYRAILAVEYSGLTATPFDVCNGATGAGSTVNAGNITTGFANDLLVSTSVVGGGINTPSSGWTQQIKFLGNDLEDQEGIAIGTYNNSAAQTGSAFSTIIAGFKATGTNPAPTFSFGVICSGTGSGSVMASGISVTCTNGLTSGTTSTQVSSNSTLTLVATPSSGSGFAIYNGAGCGTNPSCPTAAITTNSIVTVTFSLTGQIAYFVNGTTGSDSNDGFAASSGGGHGPWRTFSHAMSSVKIGPSGTIISFHPFNYGENVTLTQGGASFARLSFVCDTPWTVGGTNCKMVNINTRNVNNVDIGAQGRLGFELTNPGGQTVIDDIANNCNTTSEACNVGNSIHILGNYIHDVATGGCPSSGAIATGQHGRQQTDIQAIGNLIDNVATGASCSLMHGIYIVSPGAKIQNNVILRVAGGAIQYYDEACSGVVSNNTLLNGHFGIISYGSNGCPAGLNTYSNNIIDNMTGAAFYNGFSAAGDCSAGKNSLFSNNILNGNGTQWQQPQPACETRQNTITSEAASATFVSYTGTASGNYQLKGTSLAVNGGTAQCIPSGQNPCITTTDFLNVSRPQRQTFDIGAYELP